MNKNNKKYIAILAVLIAIFIITKVNNKTEKIINFFDIDSVDVVKFVFQNANGSLTIEKINESWQIVDPIQYNADQIKVGNIFDRVLKSQTSSLPLSESENSLANYELQDSVATLLSFYGKNDKKLDAAYFGKLKGQSKTPARKENSNEVFLLDQSVSYLLKADTQTWREKTIVEIEQESIEKVSVLYDDMGYEISRNDTAWVYEDGKDSIVLEDDNTNLKTILNALKKVTSSQFKDGEFEKYEAKLVAPNLEIGVVLLDGNSVYLRLAKDEESKYIMQKDNDTETLFVQYEGWVKRFQKTAEDFKK